VQDAETCCRVSRFWPKPARPTVESKATSAPKDKEVKIRLVMNMLERPAVSLAQNVE